MTDFHLMWSQSAAGSLRVATSERGLLGEMFCVSDDLALGPLSNRRERMEFWHGLYSVGHGGEQLSQDGETEIGPDGFDPDDAFASWRTLMQRVAAGDHHRLFKWVSDSGSDYVLRRMACAWLSEPERKAVERYQ